jgi:hypothetical protein
VHGIVLDPGDSALRAWAEADPPTAARLIRHFAGPGFDSARLAAGLLLLADLRPDDRILVRGEEPAWLPQALQASRGRAEVDSATVLITDHPPETLPPHLRRLILLGGAAVTLPPEITLSRPEDWTYPSESSAD